MANNFLLPNNTAPASLARLGVVKIGTVASTGIDAQTDGTLFLANSGVTASSGYNKFTVDAMGRVTSATKETTMAGLGLTDALSNVNAVISQTATINSAATLAAGSDATKVFNIKDSGSVSFFSVAQTGLTTLKTNVTKAAGTDTDEAFRIESSDNLPLFQVMTNGDTKIAGVITVSGSGTSTFAGNVDVGGRLSVAEGGLGGTTVDLTAEDMTITGTLIVEGSSFLGDNATTDTTTIKGVTTIHSKTTKALGLSSANVFAVVDSSGSTPLFEVRENGDTVIGGILTVNGTGTSTFAGGLDITGDVSIGGNLTVDGDATATANLSGTDLTLTGNLVVNGNTTLGDDATVDTTLIKGVTTVKSGVTKAAGNTTNAAFKVVDSADAMLFQVSTNGDVKVSNNLTVASGATVTAAMSGQDLTLTGNLTVSGATILNGNVTLGDATGDTIQSKAALAMNNNKITGLATPTAITDAATKGYVDGLVQGLDIKQSVRFATTADLPTCVYASGAGTLTASVNGAFPNLDGTPSPAYRTGANGDRILVKNQTDQKQNGIYVLTTLGDAGTKWVLTRASDFNSTILVTAGSFVFVEEGTTNKDTGWVMTSDNVTLDTTNIAWSQFAGVGSVQAGTGTTQTGNTISLVPATSSALGGIIASDTTNTTIDGSGNFSINAEENATASKIVRRTSAGLINSTGLNAGTGAITTSGNISTTGSGTITSAGTLTAPTISLASAKLTTDTNGRITKINNVTTAGNYGVNTTTANASDSNLSTTVQTTVATHTPAAQGNYLVYIYFRVITAATNLAIDLTYTDGSGAQTQNILTGSQAVGSYSVTPIFINATTGTPVAVKATAGTANQVYVSANIVAL